MSRNKKKGRISRIRGNLKYTNDDPLWKKLFYVKENIKQYKGIIIIVSCLLLIIFFSVILNIVGNKKKIDKDVVITEKDYTKEDIKKEEKNNDSDMSFSNIDKIIDEIINENNISKEEKEVRIFITRLYKAGGYSSKKTYIELLKKLNPTYNIGKITEDNDKVYVIIKKVENGKEKEQAIDISRILDKLSFDIEILAKINKTRIDEKAFKYDDIIIDPEIDNEKIEKFKNIILKDVLEERSNIQNNVNNSNVTNQNMIKDQITSALNYSKVKDNEVELLFVDNNRLIARRTIEKGSIPKFQEIPRKDGYLFIDWDKNIFTKVYENTTYIARWISFKDLGTRIICSFDLDRRCWNISIINYRKRNNYKRYNCKTRTSEIL